MSSFNPITKMLVTTIVTLCLLTMTLLPSLSENGSVDALTITEFEGGLDELSASFTVTGGFQSKDFVKLTQGIVVNSASFKVYGDRFGVATYPRHLKIDVGGDGDSEWEFNTEGFGGLGEQRYFGDDEVAKTYYLTGGVKDNTAFIRLPKNAHVTSAQLDLSGFYYQVENGDFEDGSTGWTLAQNGGSDIWAITNNRGEPNPPVAWGAVENYSLMRTTNYGSHDGNCEMVLASNDTFPSWAAPFVKATWHIYEHDYVYAGLGVRDSISTNLYVLAERGFSNGQHTGGSQTGQIFDIRSVQEDNLYIRVRLTDGNGGPGGNDNNWARICIDDVCLTNDIGVPWEAPSDVVLDVGDDGTTEWTSPATFVNDQTIDTFTNTLNDLIESTAISGSDNFGNDYVDIPIAVTSDTNAIINMSKIAIEYDYYPTVSVNPMSGNLANEINQLLSTLPPDGSGKVLVPVGISTSSAGIVTLTNLVINSNEPPVGFAIPDQTIPEEFVKNDLLDLAMYFEDDLSQSADLLYDLELADYDSSPFYLFNEKWLGVDLSSWPDWNSDLNGPFKLRIQATDLGGLAGWSPTFNVTVTGVDDPPQVGVELPSLTLWEDETTELNLTSLPYFTERDGDKLAYSVTVPTSDESHISAIMVGTDLTVRGLNDWNGGPIYITVTADDDVPVVPGAGSASQTVPVTVLPVNDAPQWSSLSSINVSTGSHEDIIDLNHYVSDIDTPASELSLYVEAIDRPEVVRGEVDPNGLLDLTVSAMTLGTTLITLGASDGMAITYTDLKVDYTPDVSPPSLLIPLPDILIFEDTSDNSLVLADHFHSKGGSLTFSIGGNSSIDVAIGPTSINPASSGVMLVPKANWTGSEELTITATNQHGVSSDTIRVTVLPVNDPPSPPVIISPGMDEGMTAFTVSFEAKTSTDVDGDVIRYLWDFNPQDGFQSEAEGKSVENTYTTGGMKMTTLAVTDGNITLYTTVTFNTPTETDSGDKSIVSELGLSLWLLIILIVLVVILISVLLRRKKDKKSTKVRSIDDI